MGNKFVIPFKLNDTKPVSVEFGNFICILDRSSCGKCGDTTDSCYSIFCMPKNESDAILWRCVVTGGVRVVREDGRFRYHTWDASFGNGTNSTHFHHDKQKLFEAVGLAGRPGSESGEIVVVIEEWFVIDISDPKNRLVRNPADAYNLANIESRENGLWLSETVLREKLPVFAAHCKYVETENRSWKDLLYLRDLKGFADVEGTSKLSDQMMLQFLGIIHGLDMHIDGNSVEVYLKIADSLQCKAVLQRCENFLLKVPLSEVTLAEKLHLADRFKLYTLLLETIDKLPTSELKTLYLARFGASRSDDKSTSTADKTIKMVDKWTSTIGKKLDEKKLKKMPQSALAKDTIDNLQKLQADATKMLLEKLKKLCWPSLKSFTPLLSLFMWCLVCFGAGVALAWLILGLIL
ncbi:hypothetical protein L596_013208 [Steinernema carpocapsae]|uniref:BTB domain-containing protein n=1 Tax=Steinernema carpocapsae TaxID=34508 RepID=A0A4U5NZH6_STECR|nr:hypothetical protein L596_013208 [Steinernema carpocapsae]